MPTFSPYNRGGSINKQPRIVIQKLTDFGWIPGPDAPDGRVTFVLGEARLVRENGWFLVFLPDGTVRGYPPGSDLGELTNEIKSL